MSKLLSITIPTYNRAAILDQQLGRLKEAFDALPEDKRERLELLVSNNRSSDQTADVLERWQGQFAQLRVHHQDHNIGAVRNISWCLCQAAGKFVWALSDDDPLEPGALEKVFDRLAAHPDIGVMVLNFSSRDAQSGKLMSARKFALDADDSDADGLRLFSTYIARGAMGALVFTSALVYRRDHAREAIRHWPDGHSNLLFQLYITAACATRGRFHVMADNVVEFMSGRSFFHGDPELEFRMKFHDVPLIYSKLTRLGYSRTLCRRLFHAHLRGKHFGGGRMWLQIGKYALRRPAAGVRGAWLLSRASAGIYSPVNRAQVWQTRSGLSADAQQRVHRAT
ncbi:glycosyltransferase family 2 protein [Granulosicoccaceae sp. 1_MG-2023]|nr:glycosyltransferase family 2 protein [Granulosicoccaceae sp. 1_MG-2023]